MTHLSIFRILETCKTSFILTINLWDWYKTWLRSWLLFIFNHTHTRYNIKTAALKREAVTSFNCIRERYKECYILNKVSIQIVGHSDWNVDFLATYTSARIPNTTEPRRTPPMKAICACDLYDFLSQTRSICKMKTPSNQSMSIQR